MASTGESFWKSSSVRRISHFYPHLARAMAGVQSRVLADPVYICVECSAVQKNQQAMAAHCRIHINSDGMEKGTVRHIKYNPDHTFSLMCHPSPDQVLLIPNRSPNPNLSSASATASDILQKCVDLGYIRRPTSVNAIRNVFASAATTTAVLDLTLRLGQGATAADNSNQQIIKSLFS
ncbi:uncharacterized protein LOC107304463 [Oryza brachyantha]|uniref:Uncharacterized protein n=1 Tax=Oryza brachyantha TaxID=4533 RepID=J3MEE8_ORYBR|nr:uncharacterized protein LOC107304463 [Oryza brachyantha]